MTSRSGRRLPRRVVQLLVGLFLYGIGIAFMIRGMIGAAPWDVLTQGISRHLPLSFGIITILVSAIVLLIWIPLRQRPGIGTILNALLVGPSADFGFLVIPQTDVLWIRVLLFIIGLTVLAAATGLYIGAHFGPGPRDGLMTGLHRVLGRPIWMVRTALEVTVVVIGWLLGGDVGVGTVAFALLVGPMCQFFMRIFDVSLPARVHATGAEIPADRAEG
ncbi:YitT family protein [Microbacterium sp. NPDC058342]|uniref:membrane protein YczE n=1 Tax=Microbacterium sp. NPDC058342 TaxID=3346454 RepID=UPI003667E8C2